MCHTVFGFVLTPLPSLVSLSKGFVAGCSNATVRVYHLTSESSSSPTNLFNCVQTFSIPNFSSSINSMNLSPSEDTLALVLANNQIFAVNMAGMGGVKHEDIKEVMSLFHGPGAITGLDLCIRKPLAVTCGMDRTVRVWNYTDFKLEITKVFAEDPYSVAFHPSGLHLLVGFADKLRLMNLLMDDFRTYREFSVKMCRECQFSEGGQMFAAVNGNIIQVYDFYTGEKVSTQHNAARALTHSSLHPCTFRPQ